MNIGGYESLDTIMQRGQKPLNPVVFEMLANETRALILDTRPAAVFANGFIPNSISIGLEGNFAQMVGELIKDINQEILLVTEEGKEEESIIRLSRVGYDHAIGYLKGGFNSWVDAGKETDQISRITANEFDKKYSTENILVIDVRRKSEYDAQHVIGAINIPLHLINEHLAEIPKDKPFVIHCAGGYRSIIAGSVLKQRGWDNFVDVIGGFKEIATTTTPVSEYVCPTTLL
jgi:rhodanese-related sulfurtransferase